MSKKQELSDNIKRMEQELAEMKENLAKMPDDKPEYRGVARNTSEARYYVSVLGSVRIDVAIDPSCVKQGNNFTDNFSAQQESKRRILVQRMRVAASEVAPCDDWVMHSDYKYFPYWDHAVSRYDVAYRQTMRSSNLPHFPNSVDLRKFMDSLTKEEQQLLICGLD